MSLLPMLDLKDLKPGQRHLLDRPISLHRTLAHSPASLDIFQQFANWIRWDSNFDPRLRELVILYIGYISRQPYEWSHHIVIGKQFGVTDTDLVELINFAEGRLAGLDTQELLLLRVADEITNQRCVDDSTWEALAAQYDHEALTELVLIISFYNMVIRVLGSLRIGVEEGYESSLTNYPLPVANV